MRCGLPILLAPSQAKLALLSVSLPWPTGLLSSCSFLKFLLPVLPLRHSFSCSWEAPLKHCLSWRLRETATLGSTKLSKVQKYHLNKMKTSWVYEVLSRTQYSTHDKGEIQGHLIVTARQLLNFLVRGFVCFSATSIVKGVCQVGPGLNGLGQRRRGQSCTTAPLLSPSCPRLLNKRSHNPPSGGCPFIAWSSF